MTFVSRRRLLSPLGSDDWTSDLKKLVRAVIPFAPVLAVALLLFGVSARDFFLCSITVRVHAMNVSVLLFFIPRHLSHLVCVSFRLQHMRTVQPCSHAVPCPQLHMHTNCLQYNYTNTKIY